VTFAEFVSMAAFASFRARNNQVAFRSKRTSSGGRTSYLGRE
jgi:hypothetical protein